MARVVEYVKDHFACCLNHDDHVYLVRDDCQITKIRKPGSKSHCYEMQQVPRFKTDSEPYLVLRDDCSVMLMCLRTQRITVIA